MTTMLLFVLRLLTPAALAVKLDQEGWARGPGVANMWMMICDVLPFCMEGLNAPATLSLKVIRFMFSVMTGIAILVLIYAGSKLLLSQGDESAVSEAKKIAGYALGGLVLALIGNAVVFYLWNTILPEAFR